MKFNFQEHQFGNKQQLMVFVLHSLFHLNFVIFIDETLNGAKWQQKSLSLEEILAKCDTQDLYESRVLALEKLNAALLGRTPKMCIHQHCLFKEEKNQIVWNSSKVVWPNFRFTFQLFIESSIPSNNFVVIIFTAILWPIVLHLSRIGNIMVIYTTVKHKFRPMVIYLHRYVE